MTTVFATYNRVFVLCFHFYDFSRHLLKTYNQLMQFAAAEHSTLLRLSFACHNVTCQLTQFTTVCKFPGNRNLQDSRHNIMQYVL